MIACLRQREITLESLLMCLNLASPDLQPTDSSHKFFALHLLNVKAIEGIHPPKDRAVGTSAAGLDSRLEVEKIGCIRQRPFDADWIYWLRTVDRR